MRAPVAKPAVSLRRRTAAALVSMAACGPWVAADALAQGGPAPDAVAMDHGHRDHASSKPTASKAPKAAKPAKVRGSRERVEADPHAGHAMDGAAPPAARSKSRPAAMGHGMQHGAPTASGGAGAQDHSGHSMPGMQHGAPAASGGAGSQDHLGHSKPGMQHPPANGNRQPAAMDHGMQHGTPAASGGAGAQDHSGHSMPGMQHPPAGSTGQPAAMDHGMQHGAPTASGGASGQDHSGHSMPGMQHGSAGGTGMAPGHSMEMGPMQGGSPLSDARDPDAYSGGLRHKMLGGMDMADDRLFGRVLLDKLEVGHASGVSALRLDGFAWYGGDYHKLFLKADGERENGRLAATRTEVLWDRVFATFWSTQLGVRHDFGGGSGRTWVAFGVQGLAPYWFDVEATAYAGEGGRTAFRAEANYDLLLTQRLILRPAFKASFYGRDDAERAIGSGLSDMELGLRLRYEIRRQFAPYVGVSMTQRYGRTADLVRAAGEKVRETQVVAGVRIWF